MTKWIIVLRGVNVSGQKKIIMSELRKHLGNAGFHKVQTYIQSGNIILDCVESNDEKAVESRISRVINEQYGFEAGVFAINPDRLKAIIENNPYLQNPENDSKMLYVAFLDREPETVNIEQLQKFNIAPDEYITGESVIYLKYLYGAGKSKLTTNLLEAKLKVRATTRNWNTTLKLLELSL